MSTVRGRRWPNRLIVSGSYITGRPQNGCTTTLSRIRWYVPRLLGCSAVWSCCSYTTECPQCDSNPITWSWLEPYVMPPCRLCESSTLRHFLSCRGYRWICSIAYQQWNPDSNDSTDCHFCHTSYGRASAVTFQTCFWSSEAFYLWLSLHIFHGNNPFARFSSLNIQYYGATVALAIVLAILLLNNGTGTYLLLQTSPNTRSIAFCWLRNNPSHLSQWQSWVFLYSWVIIFYVIGVWANIRSYKWLKDGMEFTSIYRVNFFMRNSRANLVFCVHGILNAACIVPGNSPWVQSRY